MRVCLRRAPGSPELIIEALFGVAFATPNDFVDKFVSNYEELGKYEDLKTKKLLEKELKGAIKKSHY